MTNKRSLLSLGQKLGGLGLRSAETHASAAYVASFTTCRDKLVELGRPRLGTVVGFNESVQLLKNCLSSDYILNLNVAHKQKSLSANIDEELQRRLRAEAPTQLAKASLIAHSANKASAWLRVFPTAPEWTLKNEEFIALLRVRTGSVIANEDCICPHCHVVMDHFGVHAMSCLRSTNMIAKHNHLSEYLSKKFISINFKVENNVPNLVVGPHTKKRPADFLVRQGNTATAYDVTVANPLAPYAISGTLAGNPLSAAQNAHQKKLAKYTDLAPDVTVVPLAFQATGGFNTNVSALVKDIAFRSRFLHREASCVATGRITSELCFVLMKGVARTILSKYPVFNILNRAVHLNRDN
jgi:hypothetical protein